MDFAGGYHPGDPPVNVAGQEIYRFLPGSVVAENHMTVGIDQPGSDSGSDCIYGRGSLFQFVLQLILSANSGDAPVLG